MNRLITILGPTAAGKTTLAAKLASHINGEIISADSRQVYRRMDIGTGKDLSDYVVADKQIPFYLIDIADPGTKYNVFEFLVDFTVAFNGIIAKNKIPILCGGSGMYLDAVLRGYKMSKVHENTQLREQLSNLTHEDMVAKLKSYGTLHNVSDIADLGRLIRSVEIADFQSKHNEMTSNLPIFSSKVFGVLFERQIIRARITKRLKTRLNEGLIEEVKNLLQNGIQPEQLMYYGLEYKFVTMFVTGQLPYNVMFEKLNIAIHQFAKRQMTWLRRMERNSIEINWIDGSLPVYDKLEIILKKCGYQNI